MLSFVCLITLVGVVVSQKTIGDVKKCHSEAAAACLTECQTKNAAVPATTWTSIQTCGDARKAAMQQCGPASLSDTTLCFAHEQHQKGSQHGEHHEGPKGGPHGRHEHNQTEAEEHHGGHKVGKFPAAAEVPLKCLFECKMKSEKETPCDAGCTGTRPTGEPFSGDREKLHTCGKSAHDAFETCIKAAFPGA